MKVDVVAKYIRLSDEDVDTGRGVKQESNSVVSQRRLLDGFIDRDGGKAVTSTAPMETGRQSSSASSRPAASGRRRTRSRPAASAA